MLPIIQNVFRLAKEPDLRYSADGLAICKLFLVAGEKYKNKETNLWIGATAFGKTAEAVSKAQKGHRIDVLGKLETDEWTDNQGQKQSRTVMKIERFDYIEKAETQQPSQQAQPASQTQDAFDAELNDEVPF